ncbi:MAG TPA: hypothetical protein DCR94_00780 [Firmicutes bacterium]|nr:hypothetical protein [Bacillota bacterium]
MAKEGEGKKNFVEKNFIKFLSAHGKSVVTVKDDDIVKVHVHTLTPGNMLNYAQQFGEFVTITIENMSEEHRNIEQGHKATDYNLNPKEENKEQNEPKKDMGLVCVSSGAGLDEMFKELGADVIVSGGQTMNPSTEDFVNAIKKVNAKHVILLPNNSNIVMAASQACDVMEGSDVSAMVVPSKTILQGMSSAMMYNPDGEFMDVYEEMKDALKNVKSGSVTYSIKDTDIDGVHITKGFYMSMKDKNIVSCVKDKLEALYDLIDSLIKNDSSILTVILGEDISKEEEAKINDTLMDKYGSDIDIDIKRGDQPVYSFLVGVE